MPPADSLAPESCPLGPPSFQILHTAALERECPKGVASSSHESTCHGERYCCEENNQLSYCLLGWLLVILFPLSWKRINVLIILLVKVICAVTIKINKDEPITPQSSLCEVDRRDRWGLGENRWKGEKKSLERRFLWWFYGVSEREKKCLIIMIFTATIRHHFHHVTISFIQQ